MNILSINARGVASDLKQSWIKKLVTSNKVYLLRIQETFIKEAEFRLLKSLWGNRTFDFKLLEANGRSRGILSVWDASVFSKSGSSVGIGYLAVWGHWVGFRDIFGFINVYAPQATQDKKGCG